MLHKVANGATLLQCVCSKMSGQGTTDTLVPEQDVLRQALLYCKGAKGLTVTGGLLFKSTFLLWGCTPLCGVLVQVWLEEIDASDDSRSSESDPAEQILHGQIHASCHIHTTADCLTAAAVLAQKHYKVERIFPRTPAGGRHFASATCKTGLARASGSHSDLSSDLTRSILACLGSRPARCWCLPGPPQAQASPSWRSPASQ